MKISGKLVGALFTLGFSASVSALTIDEMTFTGGTFSFGYYTPTPNIITASETIIANGIGDAAPASWDVGVAQTSCVSTVACFDFNGGGVWGNIFLNSTSTQVGDGPHAAPSGTFDYNGAISVLIFFLLQLAGH